ncbi:MAG: hypothetical protein WBA74_22965 [Cyclobacteriaceae bacterium]
MIWFRLGIIADSKQVRLDHGILDDYTSDQVYDMLVLAFGQMKVQDKNLLTHIMIASLEVMKHEEGFDEGFDQLVTLIRQKSQEQEGTSREDL